HVPVGNGTFISARATAVNVGKIVIGMPRWTQVLSSHALLDVAGEWQGQDNAKPPQPEVQLGVDIPRFDTVTNTITVANGTYSLPTHGWKQQLQASLSYVAGQHEIKTGYQFARAQRDQNFIGVSDYPAGLQAQYASGVPAGVKTYNTPTGSDY